MTSGAVEDVVIARSESVPEGSRLVVSVDELEVVVFRWKDKLYAWKNYCVHAGGPVGQGLLINRVVDDVDAEKMSHGDLFSQDDMHVVCPWHGYEYNIVTGCHPGDARIRLERVEVSEADGMVVLSIAQEAVGDEF